MSSNWVWAADWRSWNISPLAQLVGKSPKIHVVCGSCGGSFACRTHLFDNPIVHCPCGQANKLALSFTPLGEH